MPKRVAFISYETPYAPSGGIAAVMKHLPGHLRQASGLATSIITPFHYNLPKTAALAERLESIGQVKVPYGKETIPVDVLQLQAEVTYWFLRTGDSRFFAGRLHPYDVGPASAEVPSGLLTDALLFGAAAARALAADASQAEWILLLQDWEAAVTALALAGMQSGLRCKAFLTIHNSYDMTAQNADLLHFRIDPAYCQGETVLQRALSLVEEPVFTVSEQFGLDLRHEMLQTRIMAPHLAKYFSARLEGIDNGLFEDPDIDPSAVDQARRGSYTRLRDWKMANRENARKALEAHQPSPQRPLWGDLSKFDFDHAPWFILAGRDDPRQKGYDVAARAIADFLGRGGQARFLFFPIPGDEGIAGLAFLKKLALQFPHSVAVLPFIFQEGYFSALKGATYGIMPSLYEPFGMANEFYMKGTVGIGRATGGIIQQIVPLRSAAAFSRSVNLRVHNRYGLSAHPTGILYREKDDLDSVVGDWEAINEARYSIDGDYPDRVEARRSLQLFQEMCAELRTAISDGVRLYRSNPDLYYRMLVEGYDYLLRTFSWQRAAHSYARHFS